MVTDSFELTNTWENRLNGIISNFWMGIWLEMFAYT